MFKSPVFLSFAALMFALAAMMLAAVRPPAAAPTPAPAREDPSVRALMAAVDDLAKRVAALETRPVIATSAPASHAVPETPVEAGGPSPSPPELAEQVRRIDERLAGTLEPAERTKLSEEKVDLLEKAGDRLGVVAAWDELYRALPPGSAEAAHAAYNLAFWEEETGNPARAVGLLTLVSACEAAPEERRLHARAFLARFLLEAGDPARARLEAERVLSKYGGSEEPWARLPVDMCRKVLESSR